MTKKLGQIAAVATVLLGTGAVALGGIALFTGGAAAEPAPVETVSTLVVPADAPNGLATEQEAQAAAVLAEQARLAAEAEAARVAAEQAAAAEAARIATEQAAAEQAAWEAAQVEEPVHTEPDPEPSGPVPGTQTHTICQVLEDGTQIPCQH